MLNFDVCVCVHIFVGLTDDDWKGPLKVCQQDFLSSLVHLKPSVSEKELERYRQLQKSIKK